MQNHHFRDQKYNLRIELETKDCRIAPREDEKMWTALEPLVRAVRDFPVADLYLTVIHHARTDDFHVKTTLALSGKRIFTGDRDRLMYPAYERCVRKLVRKVKAYKETMGNSEEQQKTAEGTLHKVVPEGVPELGTLSASVASGDYAEFRIATYVYEGELRKRIGRWIERYPALSARIGEDLEIDDIVEEVFLNSFERFEEHPRSLPFGQWLENLIDPSCKLLLRDPDEMENIEYVRSANEAESPSI